MTDRSISIDYDRMRFIKLPEGGGDTSSATAGRRAELSRLRQRVVLIAASGGCAKIRWRHGDGSTCSERVKLTGMKGRNKIGCEGREPIDLLAVEAFDG